MKEQLVTFETAKSAKEEGFDVEVLHFYVKHHKCKVFGIDEHGRHYPSTNIPKKVYTVGQDAVLDIENIYFSPTQSLLQKWLREVHNTDVVIAPERYKDGVNYIVQAQKWDLGSDEEFNPNFTVDGSYWFNDNGEYPTYEEALEKGLEEGLKLINNTAREEH
jgi:hypothetical protein